MKNTKKLISGVTVLAASALLFSCGGSNVVSSSTPNETSLQNALVKMEAPANALATAGKIGVDMSASVFNIYTKSGWVAGGKDNHVSIKNEMSNGSLKFYASGLQASNPGENVEILYNGQFAKNVFAAESTILTNLTAETTYENIDLSAYVKSDKLYADLSAPSIRTILTAFGQPNFAEKAILNNSIWGTRTNPLFGETLTEKLDKQFANVKAVVDAIKGFVTSTDNDGISTLSIDMSKDDLLNLYSANYKLFNPKTTLTDAEILTNGNNKYANLTINKFVTSISFNGTLFTGFSADIDIANKMEKTIGGTLYSTEYSLVCNATGSFKYGDDVVFTLPDLTEYK